MKLTEKQYNHYLNNASLPMHLKERLKSHAVQEKWTFVGTDFS